MSRYVDWRREPVTVLPLSSVRGRSILLRLRIATIGELCAYSAEQFLAERSFGETVLSEIRAALAALGLSLRQE
jgi:DNA-directed RNA polymerase alpha subunit